MPDARKITGVLEGLKGSYVAGGAVTSLYTNKPINDFDIYPKSEEGLAEAIRWAYEDSGYWCVDHSSRAMTFAKGDEPNIQIMHFDVFPTAEAIFQAFDFTCCMGAFDLDSAKFDLHPMFLEHCSQRFLSFNKETKFPYASAWRVQKYADRGFTIGKMEFQKILLACSAKPITSWEELKEQIGGVYGEAITIPDDEEFTPEGMWKALDTLQFKGPNGGFESMEEAILSISKTPTKCFKSNDILYVDMLGNGEFSPSKIEPKFPVWVNILEHTGDTFYKKVYVKDGRYFGPHQRSFEYVVGQDVSAAPGTPGLFVYNDFERAKNHYSHWNGDTYQVLELKVSDQSDIIYGSEIKLRKAFVVAAHDLQKKEAA